MKKIIAKIAYFVRTHLALSGILALVAWNLFISDHSLWEIHKLNAQCEEVQHEIVSFRDSISHFEQYIEEVSGTPEQMEHFAREQMRMKKPNEDVFLVE